MSYALLDREWLSRAACRWVSRPLEVRNQPHSADAIVVVGTPLTQDAQLSSVCDERVRAGVALWSQGLAPILCFSGGGPGHIAADRPREADAMAERAEELGVPSSAIVVERESLSTADNARKTAELLLPNGHRRIWVVSQPFHTRRCRYWFRRAGFDVLAWSDPESIQYQDPRRGLRWVGREYGAWARLLAFEVRARVGDGSAD